MVLVMTVHPDGFEVDGDRDSESHDDDGGGGGHEYGDGPRRRSLRPDCCVHVDVLVFVLVRMPISWLMWLVICWNMNSEKVRVEVESRSSSSSW